MLSTGAIGLYQSATNLVLFPKDSNYTIYIMPSGIHSTIYSQRLNLGGTQTMTLHDYLECSQQESETVRENTLSSTYLLTYALLLIYLCTYSWI